MGLVETWITSHGRERRATQVEPTFDPTFVHATQDPYIEQFTTLARRA
jgi:hypothetical protein